MKKRMTVLALIVISMVAAVTLTIATAQTTQQTRGGRGRGATSGPSFAPEERAHVVALGSRDVRAHDPSTIVKCKDEYWVFYTGWGTPSYRSKDLVTWQRGPVTFSVSPAWVAQTVPQNRGGMDFWAPDVIRVGDRFLLYYSVSSFGSRNSAIAVATNPTLDPSDPSYKWTEEGVVIQSRDSDNFNTIDPCLILDPEGKLWMSFGSFWSGIKLIQLDPATGKRIAPDSPMYSLAHYSSIEASCVYFHDGYYYLMVNWGRCCNGTRSTYEMRVGRSRKIAGPYLDRDGKDMLQDGGSPLLASDGAFVGPGHAGILKDGDKYWMSMHFYDGSSGSPTGPNGTLAIRPLTWAADGWPIVGRLDSRP